MQKEQVAAKDNDEKLRNETEEASLDLVHCHGSHTLCRKSTFPKANSSAPEKMVAKGGDPASFWGPAYFQGDMSRFGEV